MSNIQTGAERMPHDLSHLGFLAGPIGRLITISTTPVIAGDSFEMDAVGALRLSPLRRGLAIDSTVDIGGVVPFCIWSHTTSLKSPPPMYFFPAYTVKKKAPMWKKKKNQINFSFLLSTIQFLFFIFPS